MPLRSRRIAVLPMEHVADVDTRDRDRLDLRLPAGHRNPYADLRALVRDEHNLAELRGEEQRAGLYGSRPLCTRLYGARRSPPWALVFVHRRGEVDERHRGEHAQR